jgi:cobalt/nickel transport system permease protein
MSGRQSYPHESHAATGPLARLDPRAKILGLLGLTIVEVTTPPRAAWAFLLYAAVLVFLVGLARLRPGFVLRRAAVVVPFVLTVAVFLPFFGRAGSGGYDLGGLHISSEGLVVLWNVAAKATLGAVSMIVLVATTPFPKLIAGLEGLRVPRMFTLIMSFMYRYSFLIVEEYRRMRRAMAARDYRGRWLWQSGVLGHLLGSLFLRSYQRAERVYVAMVSRGYEGAMGATVKLSLRGADVAFLVAMTATLAGIRALAHV